LPTVIVSTTLLWAGSTRKTTPRFSSATQRLFEPTASARGAAPTGTGALGSPVRESSREMLSSSRLAIHTLRGPSATATGAPSTGIVCTTVFVRGSMRETVPPSEFVTHTP
jgi:hypothetical protein